MWTCAICKVEHSSLPLCFGAEAPWRALASEAEFDERVELTKDQCVVDGQHFFIRGHASSFTLSRTTMTINRAICLDRTPNQWIADQPVPAAGI